MFRPPRPSIGYTILRGTSMTDSSRFNTKAYRLPICAVVLAMLGICTAPSAQAVEKRRFDIPPQSLGLALIAYSRQADKLVVAPQDLVAGKRAPAINGDMPADEALTRLLAGSGLRYVLSEDGAIRIMAESATSHGADTGAGSEHDALRLVRASAPEGSTAANPADARALHSDTDEGDGKGIPELLVKGKRSSNTDIERTEDDVQPYVVFSAEQIERSSASSVEDFLKTRLPMNTVGRTNSQETNGAFLGNQSAVDLRGLGTGQTLILINGRRQPAVSGISISASFNQPDINGLPLSAIERIEILPSTASAIYGGGATGGVVNVILKRNYSGIDLRAVYDNTFDSDAAQRRIEGSAGFSLEDGKTSIMISGSYSDSNQLLNQERDFAERGLALTIKNSPASLTGSSTPPLGHTSNIRSTNGQMLVLDNGTALNSLITYVPVGYAGPASDGGAALVANADSYNLDIPQDLYGARRSLLNNPTTHSFAINARREFGSSVELFADLSTRANRGRSATAPLSNTVNSLSADAPNNPFQQPIRVRFPNIGLDYVSVSDSDFWQANGGIIVRLPHRWTAQAEYGWSKTRFENTSTNPAIDNAGRTALNNGTLDVLRDLNMFPLDFSPYLVPSPNSFDGPFDTTLETVTARFAGPTFELPGGPMTLTALFEQREQIAEAGFQVLYNPATRQPNDPYYFPSREQMVQSVYLEARAPVIAARNARPGIHELEFQASARYDSYETTSVPEGGTQIPSTEGPFPDLMRSTNKVNSTDITLGLRYAPTASVALRVSYGTGFLPPSIEQIVPFEDDFGALLIADSLRGQNVEQFYFPVLSIIGGNADLTPEESESWSAGVIFTPPALPGLRLSLDYTRITKSDEIFSLPQQVIVDNEALFPGRVIRAALEPGDPYSVGEIIGLDETLLNVASTEIEAYDLQIDYAWQTTVGTFNAYALATWQPSFKRQLLESEPLLNAAGFNGGPLKWRGNGGVTLDRGAWTFGWNMQFYDSHIAYGAGSTQTAINNVVSRQGSDVIPSQMYHDVFARYSFESAAGFVGGLLAGTEIAVGIQNVFDTDPPIIASTQPAGGYSFFGDPRLRRYSLSLNKRF